MSKQSTNDKVPPLRFRVLIFVNVIWNLCNKNEDMWQKNQ